VVGAKDAFPVGKDPFVLGKGALEPALGQVGVRQLLAGGDRVGMVGSLGPLALAQRAAVQPDRLGELAGGVVRGGELVPRAERIGVIIPANALVVADGCAQDASVSTGVRKELGELF
jgi:hypothetical protein